ncbi:aminoglycoside N(3)-acetyltransferase [Campylobacter lari]|uniref:AAC(3) family N-acetyltransferase n=1 Tax=Campylobacter lari TaxID=201 RepID=UPI00182727E5|nr:AAC(3) family N-acetyltransferase [Campylobacter lari]EAH7580657.1 aminoglycoside N(3)-acetyltransferase [Campylobacter lari]EAJ0360814.1 aminoglycoside N(3)-acetyltransferase [Campylobacter lari]EHH9692043.1 aminoglycoside N(3)-acetyltransferase [Campylobacter lari]EJB6607514.1 aminoglycoside N(3)-acetyltransferase [Campylobacter lari]EKL1313770.1 aminoglycoside N(3)-acetyltransferase [Campylobacter lari]
MTYFLEHNGKKYSNVDLIEAFKKLGIKKGDILCVHTELFNFGTPLLPRNQFLQTILECFFEVIGKEGTLIMPTFTYSFCKNEVYDKLNSPTKMGALNEYFRKQTGVKRTNDPIFSFAIKGAKEELFLKDTTSCFGENCVYDILVKEDGKYMLFGSTTGHTLTHHIEEEYLVDYRYFKNFRGKLIDEQNKTHDKEIKFYVRHLDKKSLPNVDNINYITKKTKNFKYKNFGGATICLFNAKEYRKAIKDALDRDKDIFILQD